jgi:hypothetical protein
VSLCGVASSNFVVALLSETGNPSELPSQRDIVLREYYYAKRRSHLWTHR